MVLAEAQLLVAPAPTAEVGAAAATPAVGTAAVVVAVTVQGPLPARPPPSAVTARVLPSTLSTLVKQAPTPVPPVSAPPQPLLPVLFNPWHTAIAPPSTGQHLPPLIWPPTALLSIKAESCGPPHPCLLAHRRQPSPRSSRPGPGCHPWIGCLSWMHCPSSLPSYLSSIAVGAHHPPQPVKAPMDTSPCCSSGPPVYLPPMQPPSPTLQSEHGSGQAGC
jgi:hypothetical protein